MQARVSLNIQLMIASINVRQRRFSIVIKLSATIPPRLDVGYRIGRGLLSDTCKSIITGSTNRFFFSFHNRPDARGQFGAFFTKVSHNFKRTFLHVHIFIY